MSDIFTHLAERTLGAARLAQPLLPSVFASNLGVNLTQGQADQRIDQAPQLLGPSFESNPSTIQSDQPNQRSALTQLESSPIPDHSEGGIETASLEIREQAGNERGGQASLASRESAVGLDQERPPAALNQAMTAQDGRNLAKPIKTSPVVQIPPEALTTSSTGGTGAGQPEGIGNETQTPLPPMKQVFQPLPVSQPDLVERQSSGPELVTGARMTPSALSGTSQSAHIQTSFSASTEPLALMGNEGEQSATNEDRSHPEGQAFVPLVGKDHPSSRLPTEDRSKILHPILAQSVQSPTETVGRGMATPDIHPAPEPVIRVTIGRIEVRAIPQPMPPQSPARPNPALRLDEYLKQRNEGRR